MKGKNVVGTLLALGLAGAMAVAQTPAAARYDGSIQSTVTQKLATKLRYVRVGYDNAFDYFAIGVKDGVVTVEGQDRTGVGRDEAMGEIANMPGVKDVIDNISVEPTSIFDDGIRLRTARAIYGDSV